MGTGLIGGGTTAEGGGGTAETGGGAALLSGAPAGIGDVVSVFGDAGGASAWNAYESQNAVAVGQQAAAAQVLLHGAPIEICFREQENRVSR